MMLLRYCQCAFGGRGASRVGEHSSRAGERASRVCEGARRGREGHGTGNTLGGGPPKSKVQHMQSLHADQPDPTHTFVCAGMQSPSTRNRCRSSTCTYTGGPDHVRTESTEHVLLSIQLTQMLVVMGWAHTPLQKVQGLHEALPEDHPAVQNGSDEAD